MKALIVSDLHLRPNHMEKAKTILQLIEEKVDLLKPDYLFNLGDTFHTKNIVHVDVLNLYQDFLERITKKVKVINLVGNHDWAKQYTDHPLQSFKHIPNLTIVDDYFVLEDNLFLAYSRETERFNNFILEAQKKSIYPLKRLFSHMDLNGFTPGSGWEEISPFLDAEDLTKFNQVFSGHLHLAQNKILKNGTEIIFIGSGYTTDFGETDQVKRFVLLDLDSGVWESIPTNLTFHKTLKINAGDTFPEIPEDEILKGVEYRVLVRGTLEQYNSIIFPKKYAAKIIPDLINTKNARIELSASDTQEDTLRKYIESEMERSYGGKDKSGLDIEKLIKLGKKYVGH